MNESSILVSTLCWFCFFLLYISFCLSIISSRLLACLLLPSLLARGWMCVYVCKYECFEIILLRQLIKDRDDDTLGGKILYFPSPVAVINCHKIKSSWMFCVCFSLETQLHFHVFYWSCSLFFTQAWFPPKYLFLARVFVIRVSVSLLSLSVCILCRNYHAYITKSAAAGFTFFACIFYFVIFCN